MGYSEIRVRYRQQRRDLLRHIITEKVIGNKLDNYISEQANKLISASDCDEFIRTVQEDLAQLAPHRIAGLGITNQQLHEWLMLRKKS